MMLPPLGEIQVREKQNGSWLVWYPDPGWIPCAPDCDLGKVMKGHKHDYEQSFVESTYKPTSFEDAMEWAELLAEGRPIKVIKFLSLAERRKSKPQIEDLAESA